MKHSLAGRSHGCHTPALNDSSSTRILLSLVILAPAPATAQEVTVLTEDFCSSCSIEITPDVMLGTDGESVIGLALDIERLSDGRFVMAFDDVTYEFTVFSADGLEFRRVGRPGEGPGEYGHVWFVREHGDELHVFDRRRRRMTVLDRDDYEVVGTAPAVCLQCSPGDMAILPDGSPVLNFGVPMGGFERYSTVEELRAAESHTVVHVLGEDGRPRLSMDETPRTAAGPSFRHLDVAPDGSLVSARLMEYRIDRWDPATGGHLGTLVRDADWWPEDNPAPPAAPDVRPPTTMEAMHVDETGRLWVYVSRPTPDWRDHVESTGLPEYMGSWQYGPGATEWVIEVVDMEAGEVIVSQVVDMEPRPIARFFTPGWVAVYNDDGYPLYRMYRVRLAVRG